VTGFVSPASGLALGLLLFVGASFAETMPMTHTERLGLVCDEMAAAPYDPRRRPGTPGVELDKIDADAVFVCERALMPNPGDAQRLYQLGRAQIAAGNADAGLVSIRQAQIKGYATANYDLALFYVASTVPEHRAEAVKLMWAAAEAGVVPAMRNLGTFYYAGTGISQDRAEARVWLEKAADAGDGSAGLLLGMMLKDGEGGPKDLVRAREVLKTTAMKGEARAMNAYGLMLDNGEGGPKRPKEARSWFLKAAEAGNVDAMVNLGTRLTSSRGGPRDLKGARFWLEKAAATGDADAAEMLAKLEEMQAKRSPKRK